jgi:hypothetical protein
VITQQIDVRDVLARVGPDWPDRRDLVTRPTGRAVRSSIETELALLSGRTVVVLDFTDVRTIDCSCADEIVAKLVMASLVNESSLDAFFVIRGLSDDQMEDVDQVLRRQQLVLVAEVGGALQLVGEVADEARVTFAHLALRGMAAAEELAAELSRPTDVVRAILDELSLRRVLLRDSDGYRPPTAAA